MRGFMHGMTWGISRTGCCEQATSDAEITNSIVNLMIEPGDDFSIAFVRSVGGINLGPHGDSGGLFCLGLHDEPWRALVGSAGGIARVTPFVDGEPGCASGYHDKQGLPVEPDEREQEAHGGVTTVDDVVAVVVLVLIGAFHVGPASLYV